MGITTNKIKNEYFSVTAVMCYITLGVVLSGGIILTFAKLSANNLISVFINIILVIVVATTIALIKLEKISTNTGFMTTILLLIFTSFLDITQVFANSERLIHEIYGTTVIYTIGIGITGMIVSRLGSIIASVICLTIILIFVIMSNSELLQEQFIFIILGILTFLFVIINYRGQMEDLIQNLHLSRENERKGHLQAIELRREAEKNLYELRLTQKQVIMQAKMASLGALTAGIAHEIKNPLNFVNNFSEASVELLGDLKEIVNQHASRIKATSRSEIHTLIDDLEQNMHDINNHGKRADQIVRSMLMHSREGISNITKEDIHDILNECISLSYHGMSAKVSGFNCTIQKELQPDIPSINIYRSELSRVFINVLTNSFYSLQEKKKKQSDSTYTPTLIVKSTVLNNNSIQVTIEDNGLGVPKNIQDKILNPFFTTKAPGEGTGLGLSLSYEVVSDMHGGLLDFESVEGQFARFIITLPIK